MRTENLQSCRNNKTVTEELGEDIKDITDDDSDNGNLNERCFTQYIDAQRIPTEVYPVPFKRKLNTIQNNILYIFKKTTDSIAHLWPPRRNSLMLGGFLLLSSVVILLISHEIRASRFTELEDNFNDLQYLEDQFEDRFRKMTITFPTQPKNYWEKFKYFIRRVIEKDPKPAVFILLHDGERDTAHCIANHIGQAASLRLASKYTPASLNVSFIHQLNDDYDIVSIFKKELEEKAALVVYDLEKFPANIAQNFHALCDAYNPVVTKSVFVFTLDSENYKYEQQERKKASLIMESLWASLDDATLPPLITRLTENLVVQIHPEPSDITPSCGLT